MWRELLLRLFLWVQLSASSFESDTSFQLFAAPPIATFVVVVVAVVGGGVDVGVVTAASPCRAVKKALLRCSRARGGCSHQPVRNKRATELSAVDDNRKEQDSSRE